MAFGGWTPADVIAAGRLALEGLQFCGTAAMIVFLLFMKRDLDGRMSQMIDLIGRLGGVPNRRYGDNQQPPDGVERRSKNK